MNRGNRECLCVNLLIESICRNKLLSRLSWKWRKRSAVKWLKEIQGHIGLRTIVIC
jgi:hypothetical protein